MPGPLDDNDYIENQIKGTRGGPRGGQGGGPGGTFLGAPGFGGGGGFGYAGTPGGYGATAAIRRFTVPGATGPIPVHSVPNSLGPAIGKTGPGALNQAAPAMSGIGRRMMDMARDIGRRNQAPPPYSPGGELGEFENAGDVRSLMNYLLAQFQSGGNFDPTGNPAILGAVRDDAARSANQAGVRAQLQADVSGLDPASAAALRQRTDLASNTAGNQMMSEAMLQQLLSRQGLGDDILRMMAGHSYGWDRADQQGQLDRRMASQQRPSGFSQFGNFLGNVGGAALGTYLGRPRPTG